MKLTTRSKTDFIVIHCAATSATQDIGAREINEWHLKRGFMKIGYHFVVRRDGRIETGRGEYEVGAHVQGYNARSIGICMVGGGVEKEENNFTDPQWQSLVQLLVKLNRDYPNAVIQGHRDFPNVQKFCPSFDVKAWLKEINFPCSSSDAAPTA